MTINLANNNPRIEYSVAQGVTQQTFAVPFEFFDDGDLSVYVDGVLKVEGTDYTTTGGDGSTGTVVFVTAVPPAVQQVTGAVGGSQVVIVRSIPIERTSDFSAGSDINRAALNEQLDILTAMLADLSTKIDRSATLLDYDVVNYQLTIPPTAQRLNKYLAFGADGNLTTVSGTTSNIVVSSFGQTLVDDVDAPTALQTLGLTATAAELNVLDGIPATLTAVELGYVDGVTSAIQTQLDGKQALDADLTAIAGISSNGLIARTGAGTAAARTVTAGAGISVTNGDGVSGNPTIAASGITTSQIAAATLVTSSETIASNNNDTTLPTSAAVKTHVDAFKMSLLGTLTTTSGTTQTLSGLSLTNYNYLFITYIGVSHNSGVNQSLQIEGIQATTTYDSASTLRGTTILEVASGTGIGLITDSPANGSGGGTTRAFDCLFSAGSTSISFTWSAGASFDAGTIRVYGV